MSQPDLDDAQAIFQRGIVALESADFHEALACFERGIALRPRVARGYCLRAIVYARMNDRVRAIADYTRALQLEPANSQILAERADAYLRQHAFDAAIADCSAVMTLDPARADVYAIRARCRAKHGDSAGAFDDLATAIKLDPPHAADYLLQRGRLLFELEQWSDALLAADGVLELQPDSMLAHELRGEARQQLGDLDGAAADYRIVVANPSTSFVPIVLLAQLELQRGRPTDALPLTETLIELVPQKAFAWELRGIARRETGDLTGALADFEQVLKREPRRAAAYAQRGATHEANQNPQAAVADYIRAAELQPREAGYFNRLAWLWATATEPSLRNGAKAKEAATRACELTDWRSAPMLDTLAAACAELGEWPLAVQWIGEAIQFADPAERAEYDTRRQRYINRI